MIKNMKIGARLGAGFAILLVIIAGLIWIGIANMQHIQEKLERIVKVNNVRISLANHMSEQVLEVSVQLRNMLLDKNPGKKQEVVKVINEAREKYSEAMRKLEELTPKDDKKGQEDIAKIKENQEVARSLNNQVMELSLAGKDEEATG